MTDQHINPRQVAIIGAGPAGLMAAETIATIGHAVTVYERMPSPARKFLLAGRGGLNLTHSEPLETFLTRYGDDATAIRNAVTSFASEHLIAWANGLGEETFVGSSGRVFPKAMKASPLLRAWLRRLDALGVTIKTRHRWTGFADGGGITLIANDREHLTVKPDAVVLALGGASWPKLGSDGAWVSAMQSVGIGVNGLEPANSGVSVTWSNVFVERFAGMPLKRIAVHVGDQRARGEALVTETGLEGGAIYAVGRSLRTALHGAQSATLTIDLKPDMTDADLAARLSRPRGSQSQTNFLRKAANLDSVAIGILREAGPLPLEPHDLAARIKAVPIPVIGLAGIDRAISTAGGIGLDGLAPEFMLNALPGVFVAGEMLDWDAPTGGYLLQASFATGVVAAKGVLKWLDATFL